MVPEVLLRGGQDVALAAGGGFEHRVGGEVCGGERDGCGWVGVVVREIGDVGDLGVEAVQGQGEGWVFGVRVLGFLVEMGLLLLLVGLGSEGFWFRV